MEEHRSEEEKKRIEGPQTQVSQGQSGTGASSSGVDKEPQGMRGDDKVKGSGEVPSESDAALLLLVGEGRKGEEEGRSVQQEVELGMEGLSSESLGSVPMEVAEEVMVKGVEDENRGQGGYKDKKRFQGSTPPFDVAEEIEMEVEKEVEAITSSAALALTPRYAYLSTNVDGVIDDVVRAASASTLDENLPPPLPAVKVKPRPRSESPTKKAMKKLKKKSVMKAKDTLKMIKNNKVAKVPGKRGRKPKEWYIKNGTEPGFSTAQKKKKIQEWEKKVQQGGNNTGVTGNYNTTKEILEAIFLDHNYCQVLYSTTRSKAQPFRHIFGPKDEYKPEFVPETLISPNKFLPPVPSPPASPPPVKSKLEYLLKGGSPTTASTIFDASPVKRSGSPVKKYWEAHEEPEGEVDVVSVDPNPEESLIPYDALKARNLMQQCEKHAKIIKPCSDEDEDVEEDWESQVVRTGWTQAQQKLFDSTVRALHAERLARLTYQDNPAEPVLRRCSLDRAAKKFRRALTNASWNSKITQWLHGVFIEHLSQKYLAIYLDVLQTLKQFAPTLVDKMIVLSTASTKDPDPLPPVELLTNSPNPMAAMEVLSSISDNIRAPDNLDEKSAANALKEVLAKKANNLNADALNLLLKKPWDPFSPVVHHTKLKKLACNPVFLYVPCVAPLNSPHTLRRHKNFIAMLSVLGKVISLNFHNMNLKISFHCFTKRIIALTKLKVMETRRLFPDRPLYLIGWGTGSVIATTVAIKHKVDGVVALSFPLFGLSGPRGTLEDRILDLDKPTLFVIGGRAEDTNVTEMELLRKQLNCETSMVVIGCADRSLRISRYHRQKLLVTQSYVDKCIVDEISCFINLHSKLQQVSAAASLERSLSTTSLKQRKSWGSNTGDKENQQRYRNRMNSSASYASSVEMRSLSSSMRIMDPPPRGMIGDDDYDDDSSIILDDSGLSSDSFSVSRTGSTPIPIPMPIPTSEKKRKQSGGSLKDPHHAPLKKLKGERQRKISGTGSVASDKTTEPEEEEEEEYVSPVLSYLGATPGKGGLLQNLLNPSDVKRPARAVSPPKFTTTNPPPTYIIPGVGMTSAAQSRLPVSILAGGATATPVPGPVIPAFSSIENMRQYMLQHQAVMQQHLQQMQQTTPSAQQSPQLFRLLNPPNTNTVSSIVPPSPTVTKPGYSSGGGTDQSNVTLPADLNVTVIKPPTEGIQQSSSIPTIQFPSIQQLPSVHIQQPPLVRPLVRPPIISSSTASFLPPPNPNSSTSSFGPITTTTVPFPFQRGGGGVNQFSMPPMSDKAQANVVFKTADKTIAATLSPEEVKQLFAGSVLRCNVPGEKSPVNIVLKSQLPICNTTALQLPAPSTSSLSLRPSSSQTLPSSAMIITTNSNLGGTIQVQRPIMSIPHSSNVVASSSIPPGFSIVSTVPSVTTIPTAVETTSSISQSHFSVPIITGVKSLASPPPPGIEPSSLPVTVITPTTTTGTSSMSSSTTQGKRKKAGDSSVQKNKNVKKGGSNKPPKSEDTVSATPPRKKPKWSQLPKTKNDIPKEAEVAPPPPMVPEQGESSKIAKKSPPKKQGVKKNKDSSVSGEAAVEGEANKVPIPSPSPKKKKEKKEKEPKPTKGSPKPVVVPPGTSKEEVTPTTTTTTPKPPVAVKSYAPAKKKGVKTPNKDKEASSSSTPSGGSDIKKPPPLDKPSSKTKTPPPDTRNRRRSNSKPDEPSEPLLSSPASASSQNPPKPPKKSPKQQQRQQSLSESASSSSAAPPPSSSSSDKKEKPSTSSTPTPVGGKKPRLTRGQLRRLSSTR